MPALVAGIPLRRPLRMTIEMAETGPAMTTAVWTTRSYCKFPQNRWMRVQASSSALVAVA
jgi:hypothetical protein